MERFIAYEKLSKKKKRELNQLKRAVWGEVNPITRKEKNKKAYERIKSRSWKSQFNRGIFYSLAIPSMVNSFSYVLCTSICLYGIVIPLSKKAS